MPAVTLVQSIHPTRLWRNYTHSLKHTPLKTKALTAMSTFVVGDALAQLGSKKGSLVNRISHLDLQRTARMAAFGLLYSGPLGHHFYSWMDKVLMPKTPKHPLAIGAKVAFDQLLYSPLSTLCFFIWGGIATNKTQQIVPEIKGKFWSTMVASWVMWTPAMTLNMMFVPGHLRVAYINAVCIIWTNILSGLTTGKEAPVELPMPAEDGGASIVLEQIMPALPTHSSLPEVVLAPISQPLLEADCPLKTVLEAAVDKSFIGEAVVPEPFIDCTDASPMEVYTIASTLPCDDPAAP